MVHTFKVGDAVKMISVRPGWSAKVGYTGKIITLYDLIDGEPAYLVELDKIPGIRVAYKERRLELLDDPLPPVPDSVLYVKDNGFRKLEASMDTGRVLLRIELDLNRLQCNSCGYGLSPDDALQLAHDLRRMAMEIKRKQKREDTI